MCERPENLGGIDRSEIFWWQSWICLGILHQTWGNWSIYHPSLGKINSIFAESFWNLLVKQAPSKVYRYAHIVAYLSRLYMNAVERTCIHTYIYIHTQFHIYTHHNSHVKHTHVCILIIIFRISTRNINFSHRFVLAKKRCVAVLWKRRTCFLPQAGWFNEEKLDAASPSAIPVEWLGILQKELSNEKRAPGCLGYSGGWNTTHLFMGLFHTPKKIRIFIWKKPTRIQFGKFSGRFFLVAQSVEVAFGTPGRGGSEVDGLEERVLQTNPILESFGNAMTTRTGMLKRSKWDVEMLGTKGKG